MADKVWEVIYIVLGSIMAIILTMLLLEYNSTRVVDCERLEKEAAMLPKQCEEKEDK